MRRPQRASLALSACAGLLCFGAASAQAAPPVACSTAGTLPKTDEAFASAELGFSANFLGTRSSVVVVRSNGNVSFRAGGDGGGLYDFARNDEPLIGPFLADVDTSVGGEVTYGQATVDGLPAFCATWTEVRRHVGVGRLDPELPPPVNTFQVLLVKQGETGDFDIIFNFDKIGWATWPDDPGTTTDDSDNRRAVVGFSAGDRAGGNYNTLRGFDDAPATLTDANTPADATPGAGLIYTSEVFRADGTRVTGLIPGRYTFQIRNPAGGPATGTTTPSAGTPTAPASGAPAPVRRGQLASLGTLRLIGRRTLSLPVACGSSAKGGCTGTVTVRASGVRVGTGRLARVAAGRTGTARIRLTARGRRLVTSGRTITLRASIAIRDRSGRRRTLTKSLRIRASRR